jgi:hypothetical protein
LKPGSDDLDESTARGLYMLDGHTPVPVTVILDWARWYNDSKNRRVALTIVGNVRVSTMFLAIDMRYGDGPPILFETMCFKVDEAPGAEHLTGEAKRAANRDYRDLQSAYGQRRYATWDEAVAGHEEMVERVKVGAL